MFFDLKLRRKGFNKIFIEYSKKYSFYKEINLKEAELKDKIDRINLEFDILDIVCAWYPRKADCIHKTFLGYRRLRKKYGIEVDMVVGVRKFPLEAHAWLIRKNHNILDSEFETNKYKIVLSSLEYRKG
ncbi:lasso peptide biosynthesis B2 protein [Paenibacillus polymyxa]|uniref:lasso peptide biosynthesis B2 protein n=1 Tax=Paenibacillus polymyxa TaxID=1406 RepID=UPI001EF9FA32|nr:lasso peptide biosynthesis B2 protein [Paenibacillus polymyxa]